MAKRFIDTDLFRKPFMRSLEAPYKALWIYLLCECDHAGVWVVELAVAILLGFAIGLVLESLAVIYFRKPCPPTATSTTTQGMLVAGDGMCAPFLR